MGVPHPIPYQGSKRGLADAIIAYFPLDIERLIEPFAGSAAISLAIAYHGKAKEFVLNDLNKALINLWGEIINRPDYLVSAYEELWKGQEGKERDYYTLVRTQFNKTQRADYFLYLLARCVKASVRYNSYGEFNQSPDNRRKGARPATMKANIFGASRLLNGKTTLLNLSYEEVVTQATQADLIYRDPPYQGVCGNRDPRYMGGLSHDSFVEVLDALNANNISFIVSYDGRTGLKTFGKSLPSFLNLERIDLNAVRSSHATLLGRNQNRVESLYLSPTLVARIGKTHAPKVEYRQAQLSLVEALS